MGRCKFKVGPFVVLDLELKVGLLRFTWVLVRNHSKDSVE